MSGVRPFLLFAVLGTVLAAEIDLRCSSEVCSDWLMKNECPPIDKQCYDEGRMYKYPVECGCCEYCISYLKAGEYCDIGQAGQPTSTKICGAGLVCQKDAGEEFGTCKRLKTACHDLQDAYDAAKEDGTLGHLAQRPQCDDRGLFAPIACVPDSLCFCLAPNGERIFGDIVAASAPALMKMNCDCSRDAWRAAQLELGAGAFFAHCMPDGSYDPLQCVDNKCACIDNEGGLVGEQRVHVSLLDEGSPSCFNASLGHERSRWYRPCENRRYQALVRDAELKDESILVFHELPNCGFDGRYDRVQTDSEEMFCSDENGEQLENFRVHRMSAEAAAMDCNCARARYLLKKAEDESGLTVDLPECCPNGNFRRWQCVRGLCYCVDNHGRQLYKEVSEEDVEQLQCYNVDNPCFLQKPPK
ncbi:uncharacterized protein LOC135943991 [Cloeon dipterum]|uniref:uncharacterized protein LOC135943991 n=1 Tax=Cloeon dipterum TaxID=197152 RepID=UPI00321FEFCD